MDVLRALKVLSADRRGSSWPVLVETDAGVVFTKLRGAAQGPAALVAEIIVAHLAEAIGLKVPTRSLVVFEAAIESDDKRDELRDLLNASAGLNLGFMYLEGARLVAPDEVHRIDADTACAIVWLDGLVMNPDRTARNTNLMWWKAGLWLIDHGAALSFQHNWPAVTEQSARRPTPSFGEHVLKTRAIGIEQWDPILAERVTRDVLRAAVAEVPDDFLAAGADASADAILRRREAYVAVLWKRLAAPRPFP